MDKEKSCLSCEKKLPKANELPIYECLEDTYAYEVAQKAPSPLEQGISQVRKRITGHIESFQGMKDKLGNVCEAALAHTKTGYDYITDNESTWPKAAAITVGGLGGLLLGARGGVFKKVFYSGTGMIALAAICYPKQSFEYSKCGYQWTKDKTSAIIKTTTGYDMTQATWDVTEKLPYKSFDQISEEVSDVQQYGFRLFDHDSSVKKLFPSKKVVGDLGQGNIADKDLYTTRSK